MNTKKIFMCLFIFLFGIICAFASDFPAGIEHQKIKGQQRVYTKEDVDSIIDNLHVDATIKTNRYPMFIIDLNDTLPNYVGMTNHLGYVTNLTQNIDNPYSTTTWCEFELKATTNNFIAATNNFIKEVKDVHATLQVTNSAGKVIATISKDTKGIGMDQHMVFFSVTSMELEFNGEYADGRDKADPIESMRKYVNAYEVDGKKIDGRGLAFYTSSISDLANPFPAKVVVILDPSKFRHTPDNSWCHDHNKDLNWVFLRGGTEAFERDFNGQYVWRSIKPVAWFEDLPAWAYTNGEVRVISEEQYKKQK